MCYKLCRYLFLFKKFAMDKKINMIFTVILVSAALVFLYVEKVTHEEFFLHLAAIPLEVLLAIFIVERLLERRAAREKRRQLMFIKSHLFRAEMRSLFIRNFKALKSPALTMSGIKNASLAELKRMREEAEKIEYQSLVAMEPVIMEYVKARHVWQQFLTQAVHYNFEDIIVDMIYILNFIQDVLLVKDARPDGLFIEAAAQRDALMKKSRKVLEDGIKKFLDYAIELKEKHPEMFEELLDDYVQCAELCL